MAAGGTVCRKSVLGCTQVGVYFQSPECQKVNSGCTFFLPIWLFSVYWLGGEGSWLPNQEYGPANQVGGISVVALLVYYGPYSLIRRWMRK